MINDTYGSFFALGVGRSAAEEIVKELMEAYGQPHRAYHNMTHILGTLYAITSHQHLATHPEEIEVALWFHDSIYDTERTDNEEKSAQWAEDFLSSNFASDESIERIGRMIRATAGHTDAEDFDTKLMLDIDLSILGAQPPQFDIYDDQIRREYWWVAEDSYNFLRARVLQSFLDRENIFQTPPFQKLEGQARENLKVKIIHLSL